MKKIIFSTVFVLGFFTWAGSASAASCDGPVGTPIVDVTQAVSNDPDSGNVSTWAMDAFTKHIQVWQDATDTSVYCAQTTDNGTFMGNGTVSPENGSPLTQIVSGTFTGGARYVITGGTFLGASSTWALTDTVPENTCGGDGSACPSGTYSAWISSYFNGASHSLPSWGWTYVSSDNGTWVNASTGDMGDLIQSTTTTVYNEAQLRAQLTDATVTTIKFGGDIRVTSEVVVNRAVTIDGKGFHLNASFAKTSTSNNAAIGITHDGVTVENLVLDGTGSQPSPSQIHGLNAYLAATTTLENVTVSNFSGAGMIVNGSNVTATNFNTSNNAWGAVNVDPGSGVTTPSIFTLVSGTLGESNQIWSDGSHVNASSTVTVNAAGYAQYSIGGTTSGLVWSNKSLNQVITITKNVVTTLYTALQSAIDAAQNGDTLNLAAGVYGVAAQVNLTKNLTLVGTGNVTVKATTDFGTDNATKHLLNITGGTSTAPVSVSNIVFDCDGKCYGVQSYGDIYANFSNVTFKGSKGPGLTVNGSTVNVANLTTTGNAWGGVNVDSGVGVTSTSTLVVSGTSSHTELPAIWVDDVTKPSVVTDTNNQYSSQTYVHNTTVTGRIYGLKTVTVNSETELRAALSNTLVTTIVLGQDITLTSQLSIGRSITIDGGNHTLSATFNSASVIEITANNVTIKNLVEDAHNTTGNRGINVYKVTGILLDNVTVSNNAKNGIVVNGSTVTVNNIVTKNNGWEAIDVDLGGGVTSPANLTVNGTSVHSETKAAILIDNTTKPVTVTDTNNQYSITASGTVASYSLKNLNVKLATSTQLTGTGVTVQIPANTIISGGTLWNGTVLAPTATSTTISIPGYTTEVGQTIVVGSEVADLTFTSAARLLFTGQAGKHTGWYNHAGTFTEIADTCSADSQAAGDALSAGGNCKIDVGSDLVVWTKHFSIFTTYTQTAVPVVSGGGSGYFVSSGNGGGSAPVPASSPVVTNVTGQVLGAQTSAVAAQNRNGKVLGAEVYNFTRDLRMGSRGDDVAELQKMLMDGGYMKAATTTRYFGALTRAAVIKWQKNSKLPGTGYFGRMSRAAVIK